MNLKSRKNILSSKTKESNSINFYKTDGTKLGMLEVSFMMLVICIVGVFIGYIIGNKNIKTIKYVSPNKKLNEFIETYNYILDNYYGVEEITEDQILNSAIEGLLNSFGDPNTTYMTEVESNNFNIQLKGDYQGLGVEISNELETGNIVIVSIFKDSPADKSGLKPGDMILKIDDIDVSKKESSYFSKYISESTNTTFNILIKRENEEMNIIVNKENIVLKSVASKIFEKNNKKIGYIYLSIFAENSYSQFKSELENLEQKGIDSLILDLRSNTGGHLSSAHNILNLFLDSDKIVYKTEDKKGIETFYSNGNKDKKYKIVILVNELTASSSEIVTAGLKENLDSIVVGKTTYGKGTVQELRTISTGAQYKFTIKKWLTPKENFIHGVGIKPDYEIDLDDNYIKNPTDENDNQLQKAIEILEEKSN